MADGTDDIEARDREWLDKVYQGDKERQLTIRAVVVGMLLGSIMSLSNLYSGLKIGWSFGASITSAIIAFTVFSALQRVPRVQGLVGSILAAAACGYFVRDDFHPLVWSHVLLHGIPTICFALLALSFAFGAFERHFSLLENNTMQTAASAAGYMSSAGLLSSIPALTLLSQRGPNGEAPIISYPATLTSVWLMLWLGAVSYLGVAAAVPLKRQMINIDQLPFPSGLACAVTLKGMHAAGKKAVRQARALVYGGAVGILVKVFTGLTGLVTTLPDTLFVAPRWEFLRRTALSVPKLTDATTAHRWLASGGKWLGKSNAHGVTLENLTIGFPVSVLLLGGGALIGMRIGLSLALGAAVNYLVIAPVLHHYAIVDAAKGYGAIRNWSLWPGTALMVAAGITSFALKWRTIARAFGGLARLVTGKKTTTVDPLADVEVPGGWFVITLVLSGIACVYLQWRLFGITWWMGIVAVLATLMLSLVAARATGETDVNPIGAMGKITQLLYGVIVPSNVTANLMTANVTAGAASHSADLLTDLKTGYVIGANARKQFIAQLFGVFAGAIISVPVYNLVANPTTLGSRALPAPAAVSWAAVAKLFRNGLEALPRGAMIALVVACAVGVAIAVLEEVRPAWKKYLPSPTGVGIAFYIAASDSFAMFAGAVIAWRIQVAAAAAKKEREAARAGAEANYREAQNEADDEDEGVAEYIVPVSSGLIAGESLMGIVVAALSAFHLLAE